MVRRLTVSLMLLACLLGMIQPAVACVSQSDCCTAGCGQPTHFPGWVAISDCCATPAVSPSVSITAPQRHALHQVSGSPVLTAQHANFQRATYLGVARRLTADASAVDQSGIYLRTARLRL